MQIQLILVFLSSLNSDCYLIPILPSPSRINTRLVVDNDKPMNVLPMESTWNELGHLLGTQGYSGLVSEPCTQLPLIPLYPHWDETIKTALIRPNIYMILSNGME